MMRTHEWLARALRTEGVETVFGYIAEENQNLMVSIDQVGMSVVQTRHEQAATGMADGYARASGKVGVCVVGQGPGVAQTGTSLVTMSKKGSSVLLLVPTPSPLERHALKRFRQTEFLESTLGRVVHAERIEGLAHDLGTAMQQVRSGPVALQIPADVLEGSTGLPPYAPAGSRPVSPAQPPEETLEEVAGYLLAVDRPPVILAGAGAVAAGAREELIGLAERTGSLLGTTIQANGLFFGHPRNLGVVGSLGSELAVEIVSQAPCVLAVGCSLNPHTTYGGGLLKEAKVVQIDVSDDRIGAMTPVDVGIVGDARRIVSALNALLDRLEVDPQDLPSSRRLWVEQVIERIAVTPRLQDGPTGVAPGRLDPRDVIRRLDQVLPEDRVVVIDGGHFMRWVIDGLTIREPRDFLWTADFASIGQGLAVAAGAAVHRKGRPCVCIAGDGGFSMAIHELATLVAYRIPLTVIVWNDGTLGSEYHNLGKDGQPVSLAVIANPEFADVARGFGARGLRVSRLEELEALPAMMAAGDGTPLVVDVKVDPDVRHRTKH
jgi:acetolactate synthase-1/2/3 large subunit